MTPAAQFLRGIVCLLALSFGSFVADAAPSVDLARNRAAYHSSSSDHDHVAQLATDGDPDSYWQSDSEAQPWIYVDLGRTREIQSAQLSWGDLVPSAYKLQISTEDKNPLKWTDITQMSGTSSKIVNAHFAPISARFVRVIAEAESTPRAIQLKEIIVEGPPDGPSPAPSLALAAEDKEGKSSLDGSSWQVQNATFVHAGGEAISKPSFAADSWLPAKVPGTVLNSYLLAGAVPDPNFGDQQRFISESFFQNDFWYRKEFIAPAGQAHGHFLLNFQGINWKADVYLNGSQVGHIDGAFLRGQFDVTDKLLADQPNVLAVLIHKVANPGPTHERKLNNGTRNGGILGKDSPTFVASLGWNWMPSIRGRDIGIWDHVDLQETGPAVLVDPFIRTTVSPDHKHAELTVQLTVKNLESTPWQGAVKGKWKAVSFSQPVKLAANETKTLTLDRDTFPQLNVTDPELWWPNGYGAQPLQTMSLELAAPQLPLSQKEIVFGIRELAYDTSGHVLKISCNGQPIQLNGGNWGMDETMLRYEAGDYDTAIRLHKEMNMTMIRNWVGQVGKEEFFDACDKYGLLVWNDFWLANPADGPNPDDGEMFMQNVRDRIARIRNHPSLALYCGRNEGNPPKNLDEGMAAETKALDGSRDYIPNSASGLVTGHGPYEPRLPSWYFNSHLKGSSIGTTLHSEIGLVCVPTADSMRLMMPEKDLWPIGDMWGVHDFYQPRCRTYTKLIQAAYGPSQGLDEFCEKAQLENWENAKAIFESWRSNSGSGGLAWMSHPAWPSLICQFYDYWLNPTGAYFGARKANEPLHILWDAGTNQIKVANNTGNSFTKLHAEATLYNFDGTEKSHQEATVDSSAVGPATDCFQLTFPPDLTPVHFLKLKLKDGTKFVSENFYWRGLEEGNYLTLNDLKKATVAGTFRHSARDGTTVLHVHLENPTAQVALMVCLKVVKSAAPDERILPIFYSDNYVSLLPHETRDIEIEFATALLRGDQPEIKLDGWNIPATGVPPARL